MPTQTELKALFPNASPAFLAANAEGDDGPKRVKPMEAVRPHLGATLTKAQRSLLLAGSEADFQAWVVDRATEAGWRWRHITRSTITLASGRQVGDHDARDIPDLYLWRPETGQVMWRELKKTGGRLSEGQLTFIGDMRSCGIDADCWWPKDMDKVLEELAWP